jgi:redox-sensing transcriptional repressor
VVQRRANMRRIPESTIRRLPAYLRVLESQQETRTTSVALGERTGYSSEQVRKDLAYFGAFGTRGVGYDVRELGQQIRHILGLDTSVKAILVGAGHLGTALLRYTQGGARDVEFVAVLDNSSQVIGSAIGSMVVEDIRNLETIVAERKIRLAVLTVPQEAAPGVAERLAAVGIGAILNFAPVPILTDQDQVLVQNLDLTLELQAMAYFVTEHDQDEHP